MLPPWPTCWPGPSTSSARRRTRWPRSSPRSSPSWPAIPTRPSTSQPPSCDAQRTQGATVSIEVELPHIYSGKVRDIYDAGDDRLLLVTSDRLSVFDVVMDEPVPDKGRVLTGMSAFWFDHLSSVADSHLISTELADCPPEAQRDDWA